MTANPGGGDYRPDALSVQEDDMCTNCITPWKCNGPHEPIDADGLMSRPDDRLRESIGRLDARETGTDGITNLEGELAQLRAEVERLRSGARTLGETIEKQCRMVLDATGLHDWVDEDGDGDWGAIWDHLFALRARAEAAEAALSVERAAMKDHALANGGCVPGAAYADLAAALTRVRELHVVGFGGEFCRECGNVWPCRTARALDGPVTSATSPSPASTGDTGSRAGSAPSDSPSEAQSAACGCSTNPDRHFKTTDGDPGGRYCDCADFGYDGCEHGSA